MTIKTHPQNILQEEWIMVLRGYAQKAEQAGQLHPKQLALIFEQQWFKALVAKDYGGLQWSLPQTVRFEEAIGWVDGSVGWAFTLCCGAGWFSGFLDKSFAQQIFKNEKVCLAGSGAPSGIAHILDSGNYKISGEWSHASGAPHATVFTANCFLEERNKIKAFCFLKDEVQMIKSWNTIGLVASASESFAVKNLVIPKERCFEIEPAKAVIKAPLYQYPFLQLAECTIAANMSGMALHFMEECEIHFKQKKYGETFMWENEKLQSIFRKEEANWSAARSAMLEAVEHSWQILLAKDKISESLLNQVSNSSQQVVKVCRHLVNTLYAFTGLSGARMNTLLNQIWRDFQTGSQHAIFIDLN
ncbi:acyl-CoA dehydrogenase [Arachidicoccus sp.]|uniref:acyl-CoA dehydrogenase n=1 Tax=Arachidicoccus sp. TaxID=1872624 RepID=UPI003D19ECDF